MFRGGAESFAELREGLFAEAFGEEREEGVADERQVGRQVGLAGAGTVFAHLGIASPMVADFGSAPMSSDPVQPFLERIPIRWRAGEVATGLGCRSDHPFSSCAGCAPRSGSGQRGSRRPGARWGRHGVGGFRLGHDRLGCRQKGGSGKASKACASWSKRDWFPLIPYK